MEGFYLVLSIQHAGLLLRLSVVDSCEHPLPIYRCMY
jgi:hypothetical protein